MATNVDSILDEISSLSLEDQEMVDEIMHKRIIEGKRNEIRGRGEHGAPCSYWHARRGVLIQHENVYAKT
jgi:hypothetical protein